MSTTIKLQDLFPYSILLWTSLLLMVIIPLVIWLLVKLIKFLKSRTKEEEKEPIKEMPKPPINVEMLRQQYLTRINGIEYNYNNNHVSPRDTYIELSKAVREFVQEVSGVNTANLTLYELRRISMPELYRLIEKFYKPEFGSVETTEVLDEAFNGARRIVAGWR